MCLSPAPAASPFWQGKRVLLTGASSGLGEALARELSSRGAVLAISARRMDRLEAVASSCVNPAQVHAFPMDLTAPADELAAKARRASELLGGPVQVLLCNAGLGQRSSVAETSAEAHRRIMATNFEGSVALMRAVLSPMLTMGDGCAIAAVSSVQGFFGQPQRS
jgi:short-subunit dehydrogenase